MTTLYDVTLPPKPLWTHTALAKEIGSDRKTIRAYIEKVGTAVLDFRKQIPLYADGIPAYGMPLTPYQAWVLCQLIFKGRERRAAVNGLPIHSCVRSWAIDNAPALSKATWEVCNSVKTAA